MPLDLAFADERPPSGPEMDVWRLKASVKLAVTVLSSTVHACYVHWNVSRGRKGRTEPCLRTDCGGCRMKLPRKWRGYLHVHSGPLKKDAFVEVTAAAAEQLELCLPHGQALRGSQVIFERGKADNARLKIDVNLHVASATWLADWPEKTPWKALQTLWEVADFQDRSMF